MTMNKHNRKPPSFIHPDKRPVVRIRNTDYQPSRKQLKADLRVSATFEEAIDALCSPVTVEQEKSGKS